MDQCVYCGEPAYNEYQICPQCEADIHGEEQADKFLAEHPHHLREQ